MKNWGVILVDKPKDVTSFHIVHKIRSLTGKKKVGHTGTLDPFATGLLPICVGHATRLSKFFLTDKKTYEVQARFGVKTDSGDSTGKIVEQHNKVISYEEIKEIVPRILNVKKQIPPVYSAIKIKGKKSYELARKNKEVILPERLIQIYDFQIIQYGFPFFEFRVQVSKGTYIRSLTEQIAAMLETVATTSELRRTSIGSLTIQQAIPLNVINSSNWESFLFPIERALPDFPKIVLSDQEKVDFFHGRPLKTQANDVQHAIIQDENRQILGIASINQSILQPKIVFQHGFSK